MENVLHQNRNESLFYRQAFKIKSLIQCVTRRRRKMECVVSNFPFTLIAADEATYKSLYFNQSHKSISRMFNNFFKMILNFNLNFQIYHLKTKPVSLVALHR